MPRSYAPEFRRRAVALVGAGRSVTEIAEAVGVSQQTLYRWMAQDRIDRGDTAGLNSQERVELLQARRRIRELETELEITKRAAALFNESNVRPKGSSR